MLTTNSRIRITCIIVSGFIVFIIFCAALLVGGIWLEKRLELVRRGEAKPDFPFAEYKEEELRAIMPFAFHDAIDRIPTRVTPEETLQKFIEAMKKGDIDTAVNQFVEKDRVGWKQFLIEVKKKKMVNLMINDLQTARQGLTGDSVRTFNYIGTNGNKKVGSQVDFEKDTSGDWKIKNL